MCNHWMYNKINLINNLQTTIIAAIYDGGVIIGADSRTTTG